MKATTCLDCGRAREDWPLNTGSAARGLCGECAKRHRRAGDIDDFARLTLSSTVVLDEWTFFREQGLATQDAAQRLEMRHDAFMQAMYRAKRRGDPRAVRFGATERLAS